MTAARRRNFPQRIRMAAFERAGGRCEGCGISLTGRRWDVDHIITDWMGGEPTLDNAAVLCAGSRDTCHGRKSADDAKRIAKVKRLIKSSAGERSRARKGKRMHSRGFPKRAPQNTATRPISKWRGF